MKICLIGSTKFKDQFVDANRRLTAAGHVVYTVAFHSHAEGEEPSADLKETLDLVHLCKISNSQVVFVITDATGYFGESTRRELKWARMNGQSIFWWNQPEHQLAFFDNDKTEERLRFFTGVDRG